MVDLWSLLLADRFTVTSTLFFALLLLLLLLVTPALFGRLEIGLEGLFLYLPPLIFLGAGLSVLREVGVASHPLLSTSGLYLSLYLLLLGSLLLGRGLEGSLGLPVYTLPLALGVTASVFLAGFLYGLGLSWRPLSVSVGIALSLTAAVALLLGGLGVSFLREPINLGILFAHLLDATTTYWGLTRFGFGEQMVVSRLLIARTHPAAMFPLKLAVVLTVLYLLDAWETPRVKASETEISKGLAKALLLVLGLGPALSNLFLMMLQG
jgi:uncharacterized membrane protein